MVEVGFTKLSGLRLHVFKAQGFGTILRHVGRQINVCGRAVGFAVDEAGSKEKTSSLLLKGAGSCESQLLLGAY